MTAGCSSPEAVSKCTNGRNTVCVGDQLVKCLKSGNVYYQSCNICMEIDDENAICVFSKEPCEPGEVKCNSSRDGILYCDDRVTHWTDFSKCLFEGERCVEWSDEMGENRFDCLLSSEPCPKGAVTTCVGDFLADCTETGYPKYIEDCGLSPPHYCVQSISVPEISGCPLLEGKCIDGETVCKESEQLRCIDGLWLRWRNCSNTCVEIKAGVTECR